MRSAASTFVLRLSGPDRPEHGILSGDLAVVDRRPRAAGHCLGRGPVYFRPALTVAGICLCVGQRNRNSPMFALIDCDNFFVSCERLFRPELNGRPVVVLSSNDGCAVSSTEAKALASPWRPGF